MTKIKNRGENSLKEKVENLYKGLEISILKGKLRHNAFKKECQSKRQKYGNFDTI